jgi:ATP-binding cassette, subfamily B, bacterial
VAALAGVAREHFSAALGAAAMSDVRAHLYRHLLRLSASFYASRALGDLLTRFSSDVTALENAFERTLALALASALGVLVGVPLLFILDWRLSLVTLVALPVSLIGPRRLSGRATQASYERKQLEGDLSSTAQETISGHHVIRAFSLFRLSQRRFEGELASLARVSHRASLLERLVSRTSYIGVTFGQIVVIGVGAWLVLQQVTTIGTLIGFIGLLMGVGASVSGLASVVPEWLKAIAGMRRVDEVLREEPEVRDRPGATELAPLQHEIRLERVEFSSQSASAIQFLRTRKFHNQLMSRMPLSLNSSLPATVTLRQPSSPASIDSTSVAVRLWPAPPFS